MSSLRVLKISNSECLVFGTPDVLGKVYYTLRVRDKSAFFDPRYRHGLRDEYVYFAKTGEFKGKKCLRFYTHFLQFLGDFDLTFLENPDFKTLEPLEFKDLDLLGLPFKPREFQEQCLKECLKSQSLLSVLATGSGKSLVIALLAQRFLSQNLKTLILVPNINLITQLASDIKDYNLLDVYDELMLLGGDHKYNSDFQYKKVWISTWQSINALRKTKRLSDYMLSKFDLLVIDEVHKFSGKLCSEIIAQIDTNYKLGFTGSLPKDNVRKMTLLGLFGEFKTFVETKDLVQQKLGTPPQIIGINLRHKDEYFRTQHLEAQGILSKKYVFGVQRLLSLKPRTDFISELTLKLKGNTLVLFSYTKHGIELYKDVFLKKYGFTPQEEDILEGTEKLEFQEKNDIYFINGLDGQETRERVRNVLETRENAILISNYAILSTGVNIKRLHNIVLASPLKSYTLITQSIGRGVRLHKDKDRVLVFDLIDEGKNFRKQWAYRKAHVYDKQNFKKTEKTIYI